MPCACDSSTWKVCHDCHDLPGIHGKSKISLVNGELVSKKKLPEPVVMRWLSGARHLPPSLRKWENQPWPSGDKACTCPHKNTKTKPGLYRVPVISGFRQKHEGEGFKIILSNTVSSKTTGTTRDQAGLGQQRGPQRACCLARVQSSVYMSTCTHFWLSQWEKAFTAGLPSLMSWFQSSECRVNSQELPSDSHITHY